MKLKGKFVLREIMGEYIAIPVGDALLDFNGMLCVNELGYEILKDLQDGKQQDEILANILEKFDVTPEEAAQDLEAFLVRLKENGLLE